MVNGERLNTDDERESHGGINGDGEGVRSVVAHQVGLGDY